MIIGTKIEEKVSIKKFIRLINQFNEKDIECIEHTFFRLSEKQRRIFTCEELKKVLLNEQPFLVGL